METTSILIWDRFIRLFHWILVITFATCYLTGDDYPTIHTFAGYLMLVLISLRLVWGFVGTPYARFSQFVTGPTTILHYLADVMRFRAKRHLGHNPAGGAMIIALLLCLTTTLISGLLMYGTLEYSGPLAWFASSVSHSLAHTFKYIHGWSTNLTLILIALHVTGVAVASLQHHENLVKSMFTGQKPVSINTNHQEEP
jgi:cytochrome b